MDNALTRVTDEFTELKNKFDREDVSLAELSKMSQLAAIWLVLVKINEGTTDIKNGIEKHLYDELMGAQDYYELWKQSHDPVLQKMLHEELVHAKYWLNRLDPESRNAQYDSYRNWLKTLSDTSI